MSNLMDKKRDELEQFIREQMIGPNGCNGNFTYNSGENNFDGEVLNTTPGSIYSSAILFPKKSSEDEEQIDKFDVNINSSKQGNNEADAFILDPQDDEVTSSDRNERNCGTGNDIDEDDEYSLNRRFPNTIGISCCLSPIAKLNSDVHITISGRYYTKITGPDRSKIQVIIKEDVEQFEMFFNENDPLKKHFSYIDGKLSAFNLSNDYADIIKLLNTIDLDCAHTIANEGGKFDEIYLKIDAKNRFLLSYRERLFSRLTKVNTDETYITESEKEAIIKKIKTIERYETFLFYFKDLMGLYGKNSFGYWISHDFNKEVNLSTLKGNNSFNKIIYKPVENPCLSKFISFNDNNISLSLWLQTNHNSKDKDDKNIYLKTLLENTSTKFKEDLRNHFSIVNEKVNQLCFFGIKIDIESEFLEPYRENNINNKSNNEEDKLNYLYREIKDYGIGHLCSINWKKDEDGKVRHVFSEFIPTYDTPDIEPVPRNKYAEYIVENDIHVPPKYLKDNKCLEFKWLSTLSEASDAEIIKGLLAFIDVYGNWIETLRGRTSNSDDIGIENLNSCQKDYDRIRSNIELILSEKENMLAFRLMNTAMFIQLWHNKPENQSLARGMEHIPDKSFYEKASDNIFPNEKHAAWRAFQLAFILLNLDGIIRHPDDKEWLKRNNCVDLVWFPTGGGKTEAYLGIIALSIIVRRRKYGERGFGVSTIMRYTLRLLTTQQFQRALKLIIAIEAIRRWRDIDYNLGAQEISIGLFVGSNSLPNSDKDLHEEATKWLNNKERVNNTKIPLDICPWCGSQLTYRGEKFCCKNENCINKNGLPLRLCDDHIYKDPPTLLLGTVDKFASIAHKVCTERNKIDKDSRRIFGNGSNYDVLPPGLIIQDELHLLLGPLGSAVSLFECAIDQLCSREDIIDGKKIIIRPKIISSTATTRNTDLQIRALYDRDLNIFPKNGIDYDDSFFTFYKRSGSIDHFDSKRKYIGILPTGRTQMTTQMRLAAILLVHRAIFENNNINDNDYETVADNYYSVISYFNSLKEVGKTDAQFNIEYTMYIKRLFRRVLRHGKLLECFYASEPKECEVSGRLSSSDVNKTFSEVAKKFETSKRFPYCQKDKWIHGTTPPDYILATNMISVGLDVSRFNVIIMNSMPRNIAEYIQATSRVARREKGIVITLHNPFRSRDISHFERYREFHEKLYYYVEPISITPFSKKAINKYLALYMAAIIRQTFNYLADRNSAINIKQSGVKDEVRNKIKTYFEERYKKTKLLPEDSLQKGLLTMDLKNYIESYVDEALEQWFNRADDNNLVYENAKSKIGQTNLFTAVDAYDEESKDNMWTVPQSLRIVEPEAVLHVKI
jgi:hypothetical protein